MKKVIIFLLTMQFIFTPVLAETLEASPVVTLDASPGIITEEVKSVNFWQEADITFWQTLPFATLWGYVIDGTLSGLLSVGAAPHWTAIVSVAALVSAGNAVAHARRVVEKQE